MKLHAIYTLLLLILTWNVTVSNILYNDDRVANSSTIPLNNLQVSVWNSSLYMWVKMCWKGKTHLMVYHSAQTLFSTLHSFGCKNTQLYFFTTL